MLRRPALALSLAALALAPAGASADIAPGLPDELSRDQLDRAALLAMPAVYRLELETRVEGLVTRSGQRVGLPEGARTVGRLGTAFAVSPQGYLVSAAHVVAPPADDLAATAYLQMRAVQGKPHSEAAARAWVRRTGARPVGVTTISRTVRQAQITGDGRRSRTAIPKVVAVDWERDLVVLRVPMREAPALALVAAARPGTRIATLGFGSDDAFAAPQRADLVPAVRKGTLGATDPVQGDQARRLTRVTADVQRGDSGGPAVDRDGRVRGVVLVRLRGGGGAIAPTVDVQRLLEGAGVRPWEGRTQTLFREALGDIQRLDLDRARAGLRATLRSYPQHSVARAELRRVDELSSAQLHLAGPPRLRGGLLAVGAIAALASLGCALALLRTLGSSGHAAGGGTGAGRRPA